MNQSTKRLTFPENAVVTGDTFLTLQVSRGKTNFPHRPVTVPRFAIGAGSGCDIVLGDPNVPALHTILLVEGGCVIAEAIAHSPLLKVNGNVVKTAILEDGDVLTIGGFQFAIQLNHEAIAQTLESDSQTALDLQDLESECELDDGELSAAELVDRLEAEMALVDQFERQIQTGQAALLQSAINRNTQRESSTDPVHSAIAPRHIIHSKHTLRGPRSHRHSEADERVVDEFERVRMELEDFSADLEQRIHQVNHREDNIDAATKELAEAQNKLVAQLGLLLEQIAAQQPADAPRAIA
ncbi:FHA domain-containing protein [Symmachiella dynata]|uniref:FHA domain-containing protein n=1 Tax=Symmachiella dynata TaxID=2527995 RepID=UPI0030EB6237